MIADVTYLLATLRQPSRPVLVGLHATAIVIGIGAVAAPFRQPTRSADHR